MYVLFSIDKWYDVHTLAKFTRHMDTQHASGKMAGNMVTTIGRWGEELELSFILLQEDFDKHVVPLGFTTNQDAIIKMDDRFFYMGAGDHGRFKESNILPSQDDFTYRPDLKKYFTF